MSHVHFDFIYLTPTLHTPTLYTHCNAALTSTLSHPQHPLTSRCVFEKKKTGFLNLFNPFEPNGHYILDLEKSEQHTLARVLVAYAAEEPGENIRGCVPWGGCM